MDFSEKWGNDVATATELALKDLKVSIDEVNVIVLEEPLKGFLGIGSKLAKVRVEMKTATDTEEEEVNPIPQEGLNSTGSQSPVETEKTENKKNNYFKDETLSITKPEDLKPVTEHVGLDFIREMTAKMGVEIEAKAEGNDDCLFIYLKGPGTGTIIGKRGQTLDAIQYLTSLVINKNEKDYTRVVIDAENYREKREKTLENLADRLAARAIRTNKSVKLEPMNPYERKVIHAKLSENEKVVTRSMGEEPYRRVVITLK